MPEVSWQGDRRAAIPITDQDPVNYVLTRGFDDFVYWGPPGAGPQGPPAGASFWFGDGSDGALVLDGTNTFSFLTKSGSQYTATRNVYATTVTLSPGVTLDMANWLLFTTSTLTGPASGKATIQSRNADSTGASAPSIVVSQILGAGGLGGGGGTAATGNPGGSQANSIGGNGGQGGSSGLNAGGTGGTSTAPIQQPRNGVLLLAGAVFGASVIRFSGGSAGGGGGGNVLGTGGAGGDGGGVLGVAAHDIAAVAGSLVFSAKGSAGANGQAGVGGGGGGGGGGGVIIMSTSLTVGGSLPAGCSTDVSGGAHGNPIGGASNAGVTDGASGNVFLIPAV